MSCNPSSLIIAPIPGFDTTRVEEVDSSLRLCDEGDVYWLWCRAADERERTELWRVCTRLLESERGENDLVEADGRVDVGDWKVDVIEHKNLLSRRSDADPLG